MNTENQSQLVMMPGEQQFQLLVNSVMDYAIYMLSPDGFVISWNAGAQRFKGYSQDEIIGKHFSCFYTIADQAKNLSAKALQKAENDGMFESDGWRVRKDGSRFWASMTIAAIRDQSDDQLIGYAIVMRDITERKIAQEALRESEQRFRLLVQGVTDYALYMLSPLGKITNWNAGAERIKGYTSNEVIGTHFSRFYTEEDRAAGLPMRSLTVAEHTGRFEKEGWCVRKDGSMFWANIVIDPIFNEMGDLVGFAKITKDITERHETAIALERTKAALLQSQKLEAIGKLTGGIAHDFNNLLAIISGGIDLISVQSQNQGNHKILERMQHATQRGARLTQQLLAFARQQPLKQDKCDLSKVISNFESVLRGACNSSIALEMDLAHRLKTVNVDATQFEAALLNLIVNARDAMPSGGKLFVSTENVLLRTGEVGRLTEGYYVKVTVEDTGSGMSSEVIQHAFDPFFTTKEVGKGNGLGLSQVYGFVAQSGGDVTIKSMLGEGTSISLYLPALSEGDNATAGAADTVLIVEDEAEVLDITVELFKSMAYDVHTASNGLDAIEILKRTPNIDILFTDVMIPKGMDGIELAQHTRKLYPHIKIILASGYPLPPKRRQQDQLDDFIFLQKPYRFTEIASTLRTLN
jgi:PAS domain S-box-containing protein